MSTPVTLYTVEYDDHDIARLHVIVGNETERTIRVTAPASKDLLGGRTVIRKGEDDALIPPNDAAHLHLRRSAIRAIAAAHEDAKRIEKEAARALSIARYRLQTIKALAKAQ